MKKRNGFPIPVEDFYFEKLWNERTKRFNALAEKLEAANIPVQELRQFEESIKQVENFSAFTSLKKAGIEIVATYPNGQIEQIC